MLGSVNTQTGRLGGRTDVAQTCLRYRTSAARSTAEVIKRWLRGLGCICLSFGLILSASGCATLFSNGTEEIKVDTQPPGAAYQYGIYNGKTPDTIHASRAELAHVITFNLPGYETKTVPVETGIQGVTWWDILFAIGFAVDFASGNAYKVVNPDISATLTPIASATAPPAAPAAQVGTPNHAAGH